MTTAATQVAQPQLSPVRAAVPGDSCENAMGEAFDSIFRSELIRSGHKGSWRDINHLEIALAEYIDWYNHRCIHGEISYVPPAESETQHAAIEAPQTIDYFVDAK